MCIFTLLSALRYPPHPHHVTPGPHHSEAPRGPWTRSRPQRSQQNLESGSEMGLWEIQVRRLLTRVSQHHACQQPQPAGAAGAGQLPVKAPLPPKPRGGHNCCVFRGRF